MKARIAPKPESPIKVSELLNELIADKDLARELWEYNYKDRENEETGVTFEEWYADIQKASFLNGIRELEKTGMDRRNRSERRRAERESKRYGNSRNDSKA